MSLDVKRTHSEPRRTHRIVLTGGPGGGKTTGGDILRRECGKRIAFVPEAATMLFVGGFPRYDEPGCVVAQQRAIYNVQVNLEQTQLLHYPGRILLCDRGTLDGAAYVEGGADAWCATMGTTIEQELQRYDAVLFFQSAAATGNSINGSMLEGGNPGTHVAPCFYVCVSVNRLRHVAARLESKDEARSLDHALHALWSKHPNFHVIRSQDSFFAKIADAVSVFKTVVAAMDLATPLPSHEHEHDKLDAHTPSTAAHSSAAISPNVCN